MQVGLAPYDMNRERTSAVKDERVEIGVGPRIVEVEAPR